MSDFTMGHVEVIDSLTGEVKISTELLGQPFDSYWWSEGNAGCDCNRYLFFMRAKVPSISMEEAEYPCAHGAPRFRVKVFAPNEEILFDDTTDIEAPFSIDHA